MFLTIKKIPKVSWSSDETFNLKPKLSTLFFLCFGLTLFGLGEGLLIVSFTGASPWSVLAQGISLNVNLTIGTITLLISIGVLIMWIPLSQKFGMGTIDAVEADKLEILFDKAGMKKVVASFVSRPDEID